MDASFNTPSPTHPSHASTGQPLAATASDQFIEDLFGISSTGGQTLPLSRPSSSRSSSRASSPLGSCPSIISVGPDRQQHLILLERLSTIAVTVSIPGLHVPGFSVPNFQRAAVAAFGTLLPTVNDSALLPLLEHFYQMHIKSLVPSTPSPASFAAIGQSLIRPSSPPSSPSSTSSTADKDIT